MEKKKPQFERIEDYGPYDGLDLLTLTQAAFLWCEYKPPVQVMDNRPTLYVWLKAEPFFPDDDYPADVFVMNQELKQTARLYWKSTAGAIIRLEDQRDLETVSSVEGDWQNNYLRWGELYPELIFHFSCEMGLDTPFNLDPKEKKARLNCSLNSVPDLRIPEDDFEDAVTRLCKRRLFSRKVLRDYARRRGSVPLFLLRPEEREQKIKSERNAASQINERSTSGRELNNGVNSIAALIEKGEGQSIEFKETFSLNTRTGDKDPKIVDASIKAVAAFLNSRGGTLLIGVSDRGEIKGIERDYTFCQKENQNVNGFELKFRDILRSRLKPYCHDNITIQFDDKTEGGTVCRVDISSSPSTTIYLNDNDIYVRDGNRNIVLTGPDLEKWHKERAYK